MSAPYMIGTITFFKGKKQIDANSFFDDMEFYDPAVKVQNGDIDIDGELFDSELDELLDKLTAVCHRNNYTMSGRITNDDDPDGGSWDVNENMREWLTGEEKALMDASDDDLIRQLESRGYDVSALKKTA